MSDQDQIEKQRSRGGKREGAGRKKMKSALKKQKKSFSLSLETVEALKSLEIILGLPSQSAVLEFLVLKALRESDGNGRAVIERQRE